MEISPESLSSLLDNIPDQMLLISVPDYKILYANRVFTEAMGTTLDSVRGRDCFAVTHGMDTRCDRNGHECPVAKAVVTGETSLAVHDHVDRDGGRRLVEVTASPIRNEAGDITCVVEVVKESRKREGIYEELRQKADFLEKILHTCPEGIIGNDRDGNIFLFNASAERIFGYPRDAVIGRLNAADLYPPGGAREVRELIHSERYGEWGRLVDFETEIVDHEGKRIPIRLCCSLLHDGVREVGTIGFFTDISARKLLQEKFLESEERFRGIFESAQDAIVSVAEDGTIVMANKAVETILGYADSELRGMNIAALFPVKHGDPWSEIRIYASPRGPENLKKTVELTVLHKSGGQVPIQMSLAERSVHGRMFLTAIIRDITERKALEEELRLLSITDSLTRLHNRRHFTTLAQKELDRAVRNKTPFSVLLFDLDRFKQYNDAYGHAEGDEVLKAVGRLASKNFRTMDSCFRFGGEEFLVLLPETCAAGAMVAAERLRIRFSEIPFRPVPGGTPVHLTVSIGIAEHHPGYTLDDLIRLADLAMYAAKNGGRNRTVSYEYILAKSVLRPELPG
ncbi:MAG: PAS domain S-box protein [Deltaproteobacteria bacterium]|nr:PAS domain S-box protein [Deltaproteobacteria bacterium]